MIALEAAVIVAPSPNPSTISTVIWYGRAASWMISYAAMPIADIRSAVVSSVRATSLDKG